MNAAVALEPAPRRKVGIVAACPFPTLQGSQLLIRRLAQGLGARGHEVVVVTYGDGLAEPPAGVALRRIPRLPLLPARGSGPRAAKLVLDAALLARVVGVVRRDGVELLHAHNYEAAVVALAASWLTGVPVIYHSHNALAEELPTYFRGRLTRAVARAVGRFVDREVPRRADHCIAICRELVSFLRAHGVEERDLAMVAPGGSPEEFPVLDPAAARAVRERFGFGARPLLLYAGNLDGYQNLDMLFASIGRVRERIADAVLVVATHAVPRALATPQGVRVITADSFAVVRDLLGVADVALCPRREWSGFPMKLLNYMAAGKAVVVCAGSAKAVQHGVNGWVVRDQGPAAYADAIVRLLQDAALRAAFGAAARRTVEDEYGWDRTIDQVERIYDLVLARRAREAHTRPDPDPVEWRTENA